MKTWSNRWSGWMAVAVSMFWGQAMAFTAPAAGAFGYDVYDITVNQILGGPIGFIGAVALIVWGATKMVQNWMITVACVIAGSILIRAEDMVQTLGAVV